MNERIRELMPKPWTFPYPDRELYTKEQFEKFAEMVIRECAGKVDWILAEGGKTQGDLIKEHFGVKE
jgi:hypothetical protein